MNASRLLSAVVKLSCLLVLLLAVACETNVEQPAGEAAVPEVWEGYGSQTVVLFFAEGAVEQQWREELRAIELQSDPVDRIARCLEELFRGPEQGLGRAFPPGVGLEHLFLEDDGGILTLNFNPISTELLSRAGSVEERIAFASMSKTLRVNFPELRSVRILVGGEAAETFGGHLSIARPLALRANES